MTEETTFIRPGYRKTSHGHKIIGGVQFYSYSVGIMAYALISDDGQVMTARNSRRTTHWASVIGHGTIKGASGKEKRFRDEGPAVLAAIKVWRKMQEQKA